MQQHSWNHSRQQRCCWNHSGIFMQQVGNPLQYLSSVLCFTLLLEISSVIGSFERNSNEACRFSVASPDRQSRKCEGLYIRDTVDDAWTLGALYALYARLSHWLHLIKLEVLSQKCRQFEPFYCLFILPFETRRWRGGGGSSRKSEFQRTNFKAF